MNAKKLLTIAGLLILSLNLAGCKSDEVKVMENRLDGMEKIEELDAKVMRGEISMDEAEKMTNEIEQEMATDEGREIDGFPKWAKKLGFEEPDGMKFTYGEESDESKNGFNAVTIKFTGDYETAMKEAAKIAKKSNVPVSKEYQMAMDTMKEMAASMPPEMLKVMEANAPKGIIYANFSFMSGEEEFLNGETKYQKVIQVEETETGATLEISISDVKGAIKAAEKKGIQFNAFE